MKSNLELIVQAQTRTAEADAGIKAVFEHGQERPVPAQMFTLVLGNLREATAAVTELERRARGGEPAAEG